MDGNSVLTPFEDQADLCQLVRALVAGGKLPTSKTDVTQLKEDLVDSIDCPGNPDNGTTFVFKRLDRHLRCFRTECRLGICLDYFAGWVRT